MPIRARKPRAKSTWTSWRATSACSDRPRVTSLRGHQDLPLFEQTASGALISSILSISRPSLLEQGSFFVRRGPAAVWSPELSYDAVARGLLARACASAAPRLLLALRAYATR